MKITKYILSTFIFLTSAIIIKAAQEMDYFGVTMLPKGFESKSLRNVYKLNLSNVPAVIDDNFVISKIINNNNLRKIITLDLSGNINITNNSINNILNSQIIGSFRTSPEDSERFGCRISTLHIKARNTGVVSPQQGTNRFEVYSAAQNFIIYYFYSDIMPEVYDQTSNGMKFVDVDLS
jgi:hypothetical protein